MCVFGYRSKSVETNGAAYEFFPEEIPEMDRAANRRIRVSACRAEPPRCGGDAMESQSSAATNDCGHSCLSSYFSRHFSTASTISSQTLAQSDCVPLATLADRLKRSNKSGRILALGNAKQTKENKQIYRFARRIVYVKITTATDFRRNLSISGDFFFSRAAQTNSFHYIFCFFYFLFMLSWAQRRPSHDILNDIRPLAYAENWAFVCAATYEK